MKNISTIVFLFALSSLVSCGKNSQNNEKGFDGKTKKEVISFAPKVTGRILEIYVEEG